MNRSAGLRRTPFRVALIDGGSPRWSSLPPRSKQLRRTPLAVVERDGATVLAPREWQRRQKPIAPVSGKRKAENRERRAMIEALYPERPRCARPGCTRMADDIHEPLTRARGGSITDPANQVPLCRPCHDEVTFAPESTLGWAYEAGLLRHSWNGPDGGEVA